MSRKTNKGIFLILLIWFAFASFAFNQTLEPPKYYLDSIEFSIEKVYFKPESIESIFVNKDSTPGSIYIYSKTPPMAFITLEDIIKEYTEYDNISTRMLFYINKKMISDADSILIDKNYFIYVDIDTPKNTDYIDEALRSIIIIRIDLEREKRKPEIRLRGEKENLIIKN